MQEEVYGEDYKSKIAKDIEVEEMQTRWKNQANLIAKEELENKKRSPSLPKRNKNIVQPMMRF